MPRLKKGSAAAKAYMAKIRSKKSGASKTSGIPRKANASKYDFKVILVRGNRVTIEDQNGRSVVALYKDAGGRYILNKNLDKQYIDYPFKSKKITGISDYKKAPAAVKKLVDSLENMYDPNDIKKVVTALARKGYYIEMSMDGSVEVFRKIKQKAKAGDPYYFGEGKKVSAGALKVGQSYEWIIGAEYLEVIYIGKTASNKNIKAGSKFGSGGYLFKFTDGGYTDLSAAAVVQNLRTIPSKVGYKGDRTKILKVASKYIKNYTDKGYTRKEAVNNANLDAASIMQSNQYKIFGTKKSNKNQSKMNHKDTKSHNVNIRVLSGVDAIDFTRVSNDVNGNPRYVIHFLDILNSEERSFLPFSKKYEYAVKKSKALGGKKFSNKQYGGGIVFQSYNLENLEKRLIDLKHTTPKIKY